ncbi:hypothetical protein FQN50_009244 [Emmonsiellopsis sp. PD_5]|nr:hypothetical protein FQN50_009244 [Emmonsiellopsis sp. PD_5]
MSPRKSTSSAAEASLGDEEQNAPAQVAESSRAGGGGAVADADLGVNVEDYLLPRTLTQRLAKGVLPPNTSIQKDALLAMTKAATVFVSYLSSHANEETEKKTIAPQDVFAALSELEFDAFLPRLQRELDVYTEAAAQKRKGKKEKDRKAGAGAAAAGEAAAAKGGDDDNPDVGGEGGAEEKEPGAKRVKRDGALEVVVERLRQVGAEGEGDDDTEEHEEEDEVMEEEEQEEEDEEEDEGEEDEEDEATQLGGREDDIDLDDASDTARRRMGPDLDESGSDSDGP